MLRSGYFFIMETIYLFLSLSTITSADFEAMMY